MKKFVLLTAIVLALPLTVYGAAQKSLSYSLRNTLDRAVANELDAAARYDACAAKAIEEGFPGAANLFNAAARAERVHARRFAEALKARGATPPEEGQHNVAVASTAENLRTSSVNEAAERDGFYREAINAAKSANDDELATMFDQTRDTEVEHSNLFGAAGRQLDSLKSPKAYFVCDECGYTTDVDLPLCALCRTREHPHEVK